MVPITSLRDNNNNKITNKILNIGHRGQKRIHIPNTIPAFLKAIEMGVQMIELDVQICSTGEIIVFHDIFLSTGELIFDCSFDLLKEKIPNISTLDEVLIGLEPYKDKISIYYDLKGKNILHPLWELLEKNIKKNIILSTNIIIAAFNHQYLYEIKKLKLNSNLNEMKYIQTAALFDGVPYNLSEYFQILNVNYLSLTAESCLFSGLIQDAHKNGMKVFVWTINHKHMMERLIELDVDGIITDYPDDLASLLQTNLRVE